MPIFNENIYALALENENFRREVATSNKSQLVLMSLEPGEEIGAEVHHVDQILMIVSGTGEAILDQERSPIGTNSLIIVPSGTRHNFINTGNSTMKLFTIYSPPEEAPGTLHRNKAEAVAAEPHHHH